MPAPELAAQIASAANEASNIFRLIEIECMATHKSFLWNDRSIARDLFRLGE
jgi:hypothetical protein